MTDAQKEAIGSRLYDLREEYAKKKGLKRISQMQFAQEIGLPIPDGNSPLSKLENGNQGITVDQLITYSQKCGKTTDWILFGKGGENSSIAMDVQEYTFEDVARVFLYLHDVLGYQIKAVDGSFTLIGGFSKDDGFAINGPFSEDGEKEIALLKKSINDFMYEWVGICKLIESSKKQLPQESQALYESWCDKALGGKFSK